MVSVHINRELEKRRGDRTWMLVAAEIGCTPSHLSEVLHNTRPPSRKVCKYLGVVKKVVYVRMDGKQ